MSVLYSCKLIAVIDLDIQKEFKVCCIYLFIYLFIYFSSLFQNNFCNIAYLDLFFFDLRFTKASKFFILKDIYSNQILGDSHVCTKFSF